MRLEDRVLTLFAEGNPVPDLDDLERVEIEAAAYLAILEQRSSEVTQLDERRLKEESGRRPNMTWLAAAAAVIVLGVAIFLLSRGGGGEAPVVTEPPPTTIGEPVPQESSIDGFWASGPIEVLFEEDRYAILISGRLSDQGTYVEADGEIRMTSSGGGACNLGELSVMVIDVNEAGELEMELTEDCGSRPALRNVTMAESAPFEVPEPLSPEEAEWQALPWQEPPTGFEADTTYRTSNFFIPFSFTPPALDPGLDAAFGVANDAPAALVLECRIDRDNNDDNDDPGGRCSDGQIIFLDPDAATVDSAVAELRAYEGPTFSEAQAAELNGASGVTYAISYDGESAPVWIDPNGQGGASIEGGDRIQAYVLDVNGSILAIYVYAPTPHAFLDTAQPLLDSIVWKDLR